MGSFNSQPDWTIFKEILPGEAESHGNSQDIPGALFLGSKPQLKNVSFQPIYAEPCDHRDVYHHLCNYSYLVIELILLLLPSNLEASNLRLIKSPSLKDDGFSLKSHYPQAKEQKRRKILKMDNYNLFIFQRMDCDMSDQRFDALSSPDPRSRLDHFILT